MQLRLFQNCDLVLFTTQLKMLIYQIHSNFHMNVSQFIGRLNFRSVDVSLSLQQFIYIS